MPEITLDNLCIIVYYNYIEVKVMDLEELEKRAARGLQRNRSRLKQSYDLARKLGFTSSEAVILQSQKREVILKLAIERGLIIDIDDPKAQ